MGSTAQFACGSQRIFSAGAAVFFLEIHKVFLRKNTLPRRKISRGLLLSNHGVLPLGGVKSFPSGRCGGFLSPKRKVENKRGRPGGPPPEMHISSRNPGSFWLCWDGGASGWPCFRSGGYALWSRRRSGPPLPGCGSGRRTCRSASAARRLPAR